MERLVSESLVEYAQDAIAEDLKRRKSGFTQHKKNKLTIRFRVFDHDQDDDDDFMGSRKARIVMSDDTSKYHEQEHVEELLYTNPERKDEKMDVGKIQFRIYLNAAQIYQEIGLSHIDSGKKDEKIDDGFAVYDSKPQQVSDAILAP